jgi:predicted dehydrogenase
MDFKRSLGRKLIVGFALITVPLLLIALHTEGGRQEWNEKDTFQSMRRSLDDYMDCLREGRPSPTRGEENYESFRMVMNTLASIEQGKTITF